jgi:DNA modification methylase
VTTTDLSRQRPAKLTTEADVLQTLRDGTYTLAQLYAACEGGCDVARNGGLDAIPGHTGDMRWKRRVRGHLQTLRRHGRADRIDRTVWAIQGTPERPERLLLIVTGATPLEFEMRLQDAVDLLASLDEPADLVLADPPYGLGRGEGCHYADGHGYRRDPANIVGGYVDVPPDEYADFTAAWVTAAARALRPGGQLAVITGPQRSGVVQCAAETAGLTWVCKIAAGRVFPVRTVRQPSVSHWDISVLCRGARTHPGRVFHSAEDLPKARSGDNYPLDWWPAEYNGRADRPGLARYDNALPLKLVERVVWCFSDLMGHVAVPFVGSGTEAVACWRLGRRFTGADVNPRALRFAAARLLAEHAWHADQQHGLFPALTDQLAEQANRPALGAWASAAPPPPDTLW